MEQIYKKIDEIKKKILKYFDMPNEVDFAEVFSKKKLQFVDLNKNTNEKFFEVIDENKIKKQTIDEYIKLNPEYEYIIRLCETYCNKELQITNEEKIIKIFEKSIKMIENYDEIFETIPAILYGLFFYFGKDFENFVNIIQISKKPDSIDTEKEKKISKKTGEIIFNYDYSKLFETIFATIFALNFYYGKVFEYIMDNTIKILNLEDS
ncbi:MAG: hypothetical protein KBG82_07010 [Spirochaetes bacterium]|nr:hypothetical protein [Spirochaetota bacterium]